MLSESFYINFLGYGGSLLLLAYLFVANNYITGSSATFLILNLMAGFALMIYTAYKKAYANTVLNSFWFLISILGIALLIYCSSTLVKAMRFQRKNLLSFLFLIRKEQ